MSAAQGGVRRTALGADAGARTAWARAQDLDDKTGVSSTIKGTAQDLNERRVPPNSAQSSRAPKTRPNCRGAGCRPNHALRGRGAASLEATRWSDAATRSVAANRLRITERTKAGAAVVQQKARELNEQFGIVDKSQALMADTKAAAAGLIDKAKTHEAGQAVGSAMNWGRGLRSKAGAAAGDVVNAAKAKVETMAAESAVPPASPAPATQ